MATARASEEAAGAASLSIGEKLLRAAAAAVSASRVELERAEKRRAHIYLNVELSLGDGGEPLWVKYSAYAQHMVHEKDAARERSDG